MLSFEYHPAILERFPNISGGVILARRLQNPPSPETLQEAFLAEQRAVLQRIGDTPLSDLPTLSAWRGAFRAFGVNPTKYRSACEALLRRLTKKGDIPSINTLVDLCNLISIRYALPVAAFDTRSLQGGITVRFASGDEVYQSLGEEDTGHPDPGEVIFTDPAGVVVARRWCWRQSEDSAVNSETQQAIFTIEAQHPGGVSDVRAALDDLLALLTQYSSAEFKFGLIDVQNPAISA